jgi:hypothetical protein
VRYVPGLDRDVEDRALSCHELIRSPFEQEPAAEPGRWHAGCRGDDAIEMESRQVNVPSEVLSGRFMVVQRVGENVHEGDEGVGRRAHVGPT